MKTLELHYPMIQFLINNNIIEELDYSVQDINFNHYSEIHGLLDQIIQLFDYIISTRKYVYVNIIVALLKQIQYMEVFWFLSVALSNLI